MYKLVWSEYLIYLSLYYAISVVYRHGMSEDQMKAFEQVSIFCDEHSSLIPLTFVLAFYVSHVVSRWWAQWNAIPWPDSLAMVVNTYCPGTVFPMYRDGRMSGPKVASTRPGGQIHAT